MGSRSKARAGSRATLPGRQFKVKLAVKQGNETAFAVMSSKEFGRRRRAAKGAKFTAALAAVLREKAAKRKVADATNDPQTTANARRRRRQGRAFGPAETAFRRIARLRGEKYRASAPRPRRRHDPTNPKSRENIRAKAKAEARA